MVRFKIWIDWRFGCVGLCIRLGRARELAVFYIFGLDWVEMVIWLSCLSRAGVVLEIQLGWRFGWVELGWDVDLVGFG